MSFTRLHTKYWRLWHKLFKWEYVHAANNTLYVEIVRRVKYTHDNEPYIEVRDEAYLFLCRTNSTLPMSMMKRGRQGGDWFITPLTKGLEAKLLMFANIGKFDEPKTYLTIDEDM